MRYFRAKLPDFRLIDLLALSVIGIGWGAFLLALFGLFFRWTSFLLIAIPLVLFAVSALAKKISISRKETAALIIILFFLVLFSIFSEPSIFSGRDQGSISEAAVQLAENRTVEFSSPAVQTFFEIYGPGKALNFPGFHYTDEGGLITQFPLPYIAWLAVFYNVFGLAGFLIANSLLFLVSAFSIFCLALRFTNFRFALLALIFLATIFIYSWISRLTLSENLAMALLWPAILFLAEFWEKPSRRLIGLTLLASGLLFFTRIEGIIFFLIIASITAYCRPARKIFWDQTARKKWLVVLLLFMMIFIMALRTNHPAYREIGKAFVTSDLFSVKPASNPTDSFWGSLYYNFEVLSLYEIIGFLVLGSAGAVWAAVRKQWSLLMPLLVVSPSFIYLFHSYISSDHPWMLRRFAFSIIPALVLYSVVFLYYYQSQKISSSEKIPLFRKIFLTLVVASILISNISVLSRFIFSEDNSGMISQIGTISQNFGDRDLVLVDRLATGDGWSMMTGPLDIFFDKQAVYFFNPADFEKISKERFENIFLVAPDENYERWLADLNIESPEMTDSYSLTYQRMEITADPSHIPSAIIKTTKGKIIKLK